MMRRLPGDIAILGVAGKMGLTLGALAQAATRAAGVERKIYGVSRFSEEGSFERAAAAGLIPLRCDLLDPVAVARLPRVPHVIFMAGRKFGTAGDEELTWALNTLVPVRVADHYRGSRIVAFSTGCVYPLAPIAESGSTEADPPAPVGDYAQSCLGRERLFQYYARYHATPVTLVRLNYALDLRYGVLHDLATTIWRGDPVSLEVPCFNAIWQGDANNQVLLMLETPATPATIMNLTGPEKVEVREVAQMLAQRLDRPLTLAGAPGRVAYLNDASRTLARFGVPRVPLAQVIEWTAAWVQGGGSSYGKPTHFEVSSGVF